MIAMIFLIYVFLYSFHILGVQMAMGGSMKNFEGLDIYGTAVVGIEIA